MSQKATTAQKNVPQPSARPTRSAAPAPAPTPTPAASPAPARSAPPTPKIISHEAIAKLAFQKWQENGCPAGTEEHNWLEAERDLKAR